MLKKHLLLMLLMTLLAPWAAAQQALPYSYGFEDGDLSTDGWTLTDETNAGIHNTSDYVHSGSNAFMFSYEANGYLVSPILTGGTNGVDVSFYYLAYSSYYLDHFKVGYTTDATVTDPAQFTYGSLITSSTSWQQYSETLPAGTARIAIYYDEDNYDDGYYLFLDDFVFEAVSSCAKPTNLACTATTQTTATLSWTETGTATTWQISLNGNDANPITANTNPYTINGLTAGTAYTAKVRANCGGEYSNWSAPIDFATECSSYALPYDYGFEDGELICWTVSDVYGRTSVIDDSWSSSVSPRTGNYCFVFMYKDYPDDDPQYMTLISPQLSGTTNGVHVEFYYTVDINYPETFRVGYSTTDNAVSSFTWTNTVENVTPSGYDLFKANFPAGTKYVAVQHLSDDQDYLILDDFSFTEAPSCVEPSGLQVSNITTSGAALSWTAGGEEKAWDVYVTNDNTVVPNDGTTPTYPGVTSNTNYPISGLASGTTYYVYVRSACDATTSSDWTMPTSFNTECEAVSLPYQYDFEDDVLPVCWNTMTDNSWNLFYIDNTAPQNGSKHLVLAARYASSYGGLQYVVLPEVDGTYSLNQYQVTFYAKLSSGSGRTLAVGVMTDQDDPTTFEQVGDAITPTSDYVKYKVRLNTYTGTGHYIAIKHDGSSDGYVYIDNLSVEELSTCLEPTALGAVPSSSSAVLSWTAGSTETSWSVYYKMASDTEYREERVTSNSYTLEGLTANTTYQYYVVANCSASDASDPSETFSFKTTCAEVTTFPWTEDFNSLTVANSIPDCWDNSEGTVTTESYKWCYNTSTSGNGATSGTSHDGSNCVRFNSYNASSGQTNFLKTVPLSLPAATPMQLTFWYKNPAGGDFSVYISTDGGATHTTALATGLTGVSAWTQHEAIPLGAYAGQNVVIVFKGTSNYGYGDAYIYLDDVTIDEAPACSAPTALAANPDVHSAELSWTANSGETAWTIFYKKSGATDYTEEPANSNPYVLRGLDAASDYEYYVVANCSATETSDPSATFRFTTECEPFTITAATPYTQDFESPVVTTTYSQVGVMPVCWENYPTTNASAKILADGVQYNFASSGQVLYFYGSGNNYAVLPEFTNALNELQISFKYATESSSYGTLTLGYITDVDTDYDSFTEIEHYDASSASDDTFVDVPAIDLSALPANAARLVFKWYYSSQWGCNVDDVEVSLLPVTSVTQEIALSSGWNWVSFNVDITMADLKAALAAAAPGTQIVIKSKDNKQATYNPTANIWVGQLNTLDLTQMYRVKVTAACQAQLTGLPIDLSTTSITIKKGANWICFPGNATMTLQNAFAGFAADGDKVKSKDNKQATYNAANNLWIGQLKNLEPGNGYIFTSTQDADRTLVFPSAK